MTAVNNLQLKKMVNATAVQPSQELWIHLRGSLNTQEPRVAFGCATIKLWTHLESLLSTQEPRVAFDCATIKLWMHVGGLLSTQEARVALGEALCFFCA